MQGYHKKGGHLVEIARVQEITYALSVFFVIWGFFSFSIKKVENEKRKGTKVGTINKQRKCEVLKYKILHNSLTFFF